MLEQGMNHCIFSSMNWSRWRATQMPIYVRIIFYVVFVYCLLPQSRWSLSTYTNQLELAVCDGRTIEVLVSHQPPFGYQSTIARSQQNTHKTYKIQKKKSGAARQLLAAENITMKHNTYNLNTRLEHRNYDYLFGLLAFELYIYIYKELMFIQTSHFCMSYTNGNKTF